VQHAIEPRFRPRLVFARDDTSGAGKRPDAPPRVLVVEDDFLVSSQMEEALNEAGFEVIDVVATAEDAVERGAARDLRLVVMDIRLAGKRDGVDAAIELLERHGVRTIFATAHADAEIRTRAEKARPVAWLQKPYSMASLIAAVREALNSKEN
jgi:DNA-binding response OmpR family regulator